jgi:hypothetical protein
MGRGRRNRAEVDHDSSQVQNGSQVPDGSSGVDPYAAERVLFPQSVVNLPPVHGGQQAMEDMRARREMNRAHDWERERRRAAVENDARGLANRKENEDEPGSAPSTGRGLQEATVNEGVLPEIGPKNMTEIITPIKTAQREEEA